MHTIWAVIRLTRLDSSLLGFLGLFVPFYARSKDLTGSLGPSIPLLLIWMCTFIANDLDDLERDQVNHPDRPLPRRHLSLPSAALLYFACLGLSLFLTRRFVDERAAFWYYALLAVSISYGYIVEYLPSVKAPYVATAIAVPLFIVATTYPEERQLYMVATAGFFFALGRELCMDIVDRTGDQISLIHRIPTRPLAASAFVAQTIGLVLLLEQSRTMVDWIVLTSMALVLLVSGLLWFTLRQYKFAYRLMKVQLLIGLYFLA